MFSNCHMYFLRSGTRFLCFHSHIALFSNCNISLEVKPDLWCFQIHVFRSETRLICFQSHVSSEVKPDFSVFKAIFLQEWNQISLFSKPYFFRSETRCLCFQSHISSKVKKDFSVFKAIFLQKWNQISRVIDPGRNCSVGRKVSEEVRHFLMQYNTNTTQIQYEYRTNTKQMQHKYKTKQKQYK